MIHTYDSHDQNLPCKITKANTNKLCNITFDIEHDMKPPVLVYYQIENFYQNHRVYAVSRDDRQVSESGELAIEVKRREQCFENQ